MDRGSGRYGTAKAGFVFFIDGERGSSDGRCILDGEMKTGVSVAVPIPQDIVLDLQTFPTKAYYDAYHSLNAKLDDIVLCGTAYLRKHGYCAFANTTKAVKQDINWCTPLPHKTVATRAGLGWIGKNCLLVTKKYGSAVRLSSFITNAPLSPDSPIDESQCGDCRVCVEHCPADALTGKLWDVKMKREELFHKEACKKMQIERMKQATGIETDLCGLCFAVCAYTQSYLKREEI